MKSPRKGIGVTRERAASTKKKGLLGRRLSLRKKDEQSPKPTPSKVDEEESQIHSEKRPTVPQSVHDHQDEEPVNEGDIQFSDKDKDEIEAENKEIVSGQ